VQHAFNPALLEGLFGELVERMAPRDPPRQWKALKNLVAVDGSLLPGLPRMTWALWQDEKHRPDLHVLPRWPPTGKDSERDVAKRVREARGEGAEP
jgi:hypothetical protein